MRPRTGDSMVLSSLRVRRPASSALSSPESCAASSCRESCSSVASASPCLTPSPASTRTSSILTPSGRKTSSVSALSSLPLPVMVASTSPRAMVQVSGRLSSVALLRAAKKEAPTSAMARTQTPRTSGQRRRAFFRVFIRQTSYLFPGRAYPDSATSIQPQPAAAAGRGGSVPPVEVELRLRGDDRHDACARTVI